MPKKILICEDDKDIAEGLSDRFKIKEYEPSIELVDEKGCTETCIEGRVQDAVLRAQPDYLIVDGLRWMYDCVIEAAKRAKPGIIPIVFASDGNLIKAAREKGYAAFQKPDSTDMIDFIRKGND